MPTVFVSVSPAEVIVTEGAPRLVPIAGTLLSYVSNTDAHLFVENGTYYYLVAGRWYSAKGLDGPWTYATASLPADFARIPPGSARGYVLVSVPGTPQAQEAVMQTTVPTQATLDRGTTTVEIVYSGEPKFEPIAGTEMMHAVNTMYDVIEVGDKYYACYQGAWFVAPSPSSGWILASSVPTVIYTIPASSPLYRVTFVKVYGDTATTVTYGYTTGYTMSYVSSGVVVYGTGYYYPPVIWPAPIPIYYPYPYHVVGIHLVQPGHRRVGARRDGLRTLRWRGQWRHGVQPEHRCVGARRRRVRTEWRCRRMVRLQPVDRRLHAWQRILGHEQRHGEHELVQRPHRHHRLDEPELQPVRKLGLEHVQRCEQDREHAASEQRARKRGQLQVEHRGRRCGRQGCRREQRGSCEDLGRRCVCRRGRQRLQENVGWLVEIQRWFVESRSTSNEFEPGITPAEPVGAHAAVGNKFEPGIASAESVGAHAAVGNKFEPGIASAEPVGADAAVAGIAEYFGRNRARIGLALRG